MRDGLARKAGERIKKDLQDAWAGILTVTVLVLGALLLGRGLCPLREVTGLPCPGCGLTRSFLLIAQGRFGEAWRMHPFSYGWLLLAVLSAWERYIYPALRECRGESIPETGRLWKIGLILVCAGMLFYYVYRMGTCFPDTEPMTYRRDNLLELLLRARGLAI